MSETRTGRSAAPGLFEIMEVLGRDVTLARQARGEAIQAGDEVRGTELALAAFWSRLKRFFF